VAEWREALLGVPPAKTEKVTTQPKTTKAIPKPSLGKEVLERAEQSLADYLGPVARVVVKRAAAKARDERELYLLLGDEIEDPDERKAFVRRGVSMSGKP
jgi:serine/threonine-protein kinase